MSQTRPELLPEECPVSLEISTPKLPYTAEYWSHNPPLHKSGTWRFMAAQPIFTQLMMQICRFQKTLYRNFAGVTAQISSPAAGKF